MVYEYGLAPPSGWEEKKEYVSESYEWQIGEMGGFHSFRAVDSENVRSEKEFAEGIVTEMKANGATVTYIKVSLSELIPDPMFDRDYYEVTIDCVFKGSPIAWYVVAAILIGFFLVTIIAAPIIWKYAGLSPEDVGNYLKELEDAFRKLMEPIIIIAILFIIGLFVLLGGEVSKKGIRAKGR